jgi:ABC-type transporter Mla subunit MlaD
MEIAKNVRPLVTTESLATIGSLSLLGESIVDLSASSAGRPLNDWEYVKSGVSNGPFGALQSSASQSLAARPLEAATRDARSRAVYEARIAITIDSATSQAL